ncbi:MAG: carbohydrate ABC transporter permease [Defluviitaleaceae bacterium]|nr:carbohydrate ABC transporter permease [Defluviitaleaceae bacterium]
MTNVNAENNAAANMPIKRSNIPKIKRRFRKFFLHFIRYALIINIAYMILYPLLTATVTAFTHPGDTGLTTFIWIPPRFSFDITRMAWHVLYYPRNFAYTLFATGIVVIFQMFGGAFFGYSLARLRFKGSNIFFALVVLTIIVPATAIHVPRLIMFTNFDIFGLFTAFNGAPSNLRNEAGSMFWLAFTGFGLSGGLFIFIFRQFFRGVPKELEEAAYIDGAGFIRTFFRIVLPVAKLSFVTVGTLSFVWNWNDTFMVGLFNNRPGGPLEAGYLQLRRSWLLSNHGGGVTSSIQLARGQLDRAIQNDIVYLTTQVYDQGVRDVVNLLVMIPMILLFLIVQKQFVQGVERSGIVG